MKKQKRVNVELIRDEARGRWMHILSALAPELDEAIKKRGRHVQCPMHGGKRDFRFYRNAPETGGAVCTCGAWHDGFSLLMAFKGWDFITAAKAVGEELGIVEETSLEPLRAQPKRPARKRELPPRELVRRPTQEDEERKLKKLSSTWVESVPLKDPQAKPARTYLQKRGVLCRALVDSPALRFHPSLPYYQSYEDENGRECFKLIGNFPAIISVVVDKVGRPASLHRTYLSPRGARKAPVEKPKKMMQSPDSLSITGGYIPLMRPGPIVGLAEGLETSAAIIKATGMPVLPTVSASLLAKWHPFENTRQVYIWADKDRSRTGEKVADELRERLKESGIQVKVLLPPLPLGRAKSVDWADVLVRYGQNGFPHPRFLGAGSRAA